MKEIALRFNYAPASSSSFQLDIDTVLPGSGITGIFGRSGSGKTSLLRCVAGLINTKKSKCVVNDKIWQDESQFVPVHERQLGYVFQQANLFGHLNVEQNLNYGYSRITRSQRKINFDETVSLLGINELLKRNVQTLSGGQRQRIAIARALLTSPELLLMDEPMASLDSDSKQEIIPYLERLHNVLDIPVLYVSHSLDELLRIADRLLIIEAGKIIANGPLNELLIREDLPLAKLDEASVVYQGYLTNITNEFHLGEVATPLGKFLVSETVIKRAMPNVKDTNNSVRIRIAARDVSITLTAANDTSISHVLPARVESIQPTNDSAKALIRLKVNNDFLLASITMRSVAQLQLEQGKKVFAQVKSIALI